MVNQKECYSYFFLSFLFFLEIFFYSIWNIEVTKNYDRVMIKKIFYLSFFVSFFTYKKSQKYIIIFFPA